VTVRALEQGRCISKVVGTGTLDTFEEVEWIGTKQGEDCIEGAGGGGIVGEGGYGRGGRRKEETTDGQLPGFGLLSN
jgi:hypothetical protein